jgi:hypothetical protein
VIVDGAATDRRESRDLVDGEAEKAELRERLELVLGNMREGLLEVEQPRMRRLGKPPAGRTPARQVSKLRIPLDKRSDLVE